MGNSKETQVTDPKHGFRVLSMGSRLNLSNSDSTQICSRITLSPLILDSWSLDKKHSLVVCSQCSTTQREMKLFRLVRMALGSI